MKLNLICVLLVATALGIPAAAQIGIYIGRTPPPLRYEERGPEPGPGYAWVDGYWAPNGRNIVGWQAVGTVPLMKAPIRAMLTTITSAKAGNCMRATGIVRILIGNMETMAKIRDTTAITN